MNSPAELTDAAFDERARAVHDDALVNLSARVQTQLAQRRRSSSCAHTPLARRSLLPWAGMATAAVALGLVMQLRPPSTRDGQPALQQPRASTASVQSVSSAYPGGPTADDDTLLSEDPEFYLWLAANGRPATME